MAVVVRMPSVIAQATEAGIQAWLVAPGQSVSAGDILAEIETEKAVFELEAEVEGTVGRLLVDEGASVPVGTPIAVLTSEGEGTEAVDLALAEAGASGSSSTTTGGMPAERPRVDSGEAQGESAAEPHEVEQVGSRRIVATPLVRRLAAQAGVALTAVQGTGPRGRIVRRDLEAHLAGREAREVAEPAGPATKADASSEGATSADFTDVPLTGMRRAIARRLTESKSTVPHFYVTGHVRVGQLLELRKRVNATAPRKVSVNDFVLKAVACALARVPEANAIWAGDSIRQFTGVDLAVAVAIDNGLVTPVVRGVDRLSVGQISATVGDLAERARAGRLQQQELEGGSFSVSNLGMYGVDEFSAILNPPQSGILAVSAAKRRAVVEEDDSVVAADVMTVTLSADHRVIDGALAAQWMRTFVSLVEDPLSILI